jgi:hypothetical protein
MTGGFRPPHGRKTLPARLAVAMIGRDKCQVIRQVNIHPATDLIPPLEDAISDSFALGYSAILRPWSTELKANRLREQGSLEV